ncbi:hypothetical protein JCM19239_764 [Vibrio variabilis]|uniref:Uncharacterized protein n=1 Tax=Vibrio variabilis TaxID=990271 RepID=A0ABQ0JLK9_9VIBR|nr:hypothetical protein JCM19239_764 [Vibrio variabilis]
MNAMHQEQERGHDIEAMAPLPGNGWKIFSIKTNQTNPKGDFC